MGLARRARLVTQIMFVMTIVCNSITARVVYGSSAVKLDAAGL